MNLAPSHLHSLSPSHASKHANRHTNRQRSTRAHALLSVMLCSAAAYSPAAHADTDRPPLLTALQGETPSTHISVSAINPADAVQLGSTRVVPERVARATALQAEPKEMPRARVAFQAAPRRILTPLPNLGAHGTARTSLAKTTGSGVRVFSAPTAGAKIRLARADETPFSTQPPATLIPRIVTSAKKSETASTPVLPAMGEDSQVIDVKQALKTPPALPANWQNFAVPIDAPAPSPQPATRLAQNSTAPPLRQPQAPVTSSDRLPNQIEVAASTYVVLITKVDLETVAIADPDIADVTIVNARAVLVNGKSSGVTTLVVVDRLGKIRQYQVRVVPSQGAREVDIARIIAIEGVGVRRVQDSIILEGEVANADEMKRAVDIAGIFSDKVINQLHLRGGPVDEGMLTAAQIQEAIDRPEVRVRVAGKKAILDGTVANEAERQRAEMIARTYAEDVVNALRLPPLTVEQLRDMLGGFDKANAASETVGMAGQLLPPPRLVVRRVGDQVVLEGTLPSQAEVDAAIASASRTGLQVVNRLAVSPTQPAEAALLNMVAQAIGVPGVQVRGTSKRLVLVGQVPDTNTAMRAGQVALGFATDVDNMLVVASPTQVNVEVSIAEIAKTDFKNLGISFPGLTDGSIDFSGGLSLGNIGVGSAGPNTSLGTNFETAFRAQIDKGNIRILSNPRTTVLSGRTASFQAGGQIPIPVNAQVTGTGITTVEIEFKDFGVLMDVTPVGTTDGAVTMRVRTDITQLDPEVGFIAVAPGITVPSFTRRAAVTEVTTRSGGTIALGGLISSNVRKAVREIPLLSRIPIIGSLFTSKRFLRGETELVIFVTPRVLPNPMLDGVLAPSTPIAVGPSTVAPTVLGNPGIGTFGTIGGTGVQPSGGGEGGGGGG